MEAEESAKEAAAAAAAVWVCALWAAASAAAAAAALASDAIDPLRGRRRRRGFPLKSQAAVFSELPSLCGSGTHTKNIVSEQVHKT